MHCLQVKYRDSSTVCSKETALGRWEMASKSTHWSFLIPQRRKACLGTTLLSGSLAFALPHSLVEDLPSKGLCITFSCNQVPEKQQLREEGEAICLRFEGPPSIMVEKAGWRCHGVVGHILTAVRQQRKVGALSFSFLFSPGLQPPRWYSQAMGDSSSFLKHCWEHSHKYTLSGSPW